MPRRCCHNAEILITLSDAMSYARDILAGLDHLLLEVADYIAQDIPTTVSADDRAKIIAAVRERIGAAREALCEENPKLDAASPPTVLAHMG